MLSYYICDTETTGLAEHHEIVQISIIRVEDRVQLSRDIKALRPDLASPQALQVTNKSILDITTKGMDHDAAVNLFDDFIKEDGLTNENRVFVAHNSVFDMKFLHRLWKKNNKQFPSANWLCSIKMAKAYAKMNGIQTKFNLRSSLEMMKIAGNTRFHSASGDCVATHDLWKKLMESGIDYVNLIERIPHVLDPEFGQD